MGGKIGTSCLEVTSDEIGPISPATKTLLSFLSHFNTAEVTETDSKGTKVPTSGLQDLLLVKGVLHHVCEVGRQTYKKKRHYRTQKKTNALLFLKKLIHFYTSLTCKVIRKYTDHPSGLIQNRTEPL